jgi:hypothetical protein
MGTQRDGLDVALRALAVRLAGDPAAGSQRDAAAPSRGNLVPERFDIAGLLAMPLDRFAREGHCLEVRVAWHHETLWFVPDERDAAALGREGVGRGRVWTARELMDLMTLSDLTLATVRTLALAKCVIDGDIVEVRSR